MRTASLRGNDEDEMAERRAETARWLYAERRRREGTFGELAGAFRDPAWDVTLDLYVAWMEGRAVSASSASIASATPMTTGLRCIEGMIRAGIAFRTGDPVDARRSLIALTVDARERMDRYLDGVERPTAAATRGIHPAAHRCVPGRSAMGSSLPSERSTGDVRHRGDASASVRPVGTDPCFAKTASGSPAAVEGDA